MGLAAVVDAAVISGGCRNAPVSTGGDFSQFVGLADFAKFTRTESGKDEIILLSPPVESRLRWNQLIVSWNASAPAGTFLKIEARAISGGHQSKFYTMGNWSLDDQSHPRATVRGQRDADGTVETDTLVLSETAEAAQIRVTLGGAAGERLALRFLGACFANTRVARVTRPPNRAAWGKIIATPEHSQHGWPNERG
jgi:hypothetical protein